MVEIEQELCALVARHVSAFQHISNKKYSIRKLPFTSKIIWKGNRYGREIDKIFKDMNGGKISLKQADRQMINLMKRYYEVN